MHYDQQPQIYSRIHPNELSPFIISVNKKLNVHDDTVNIPVVCVGTRVERSLSGTSMWVQEKNVKNHECHSCVHGDVAVSLRDTATYYSHVDAHTRKGEDEEFASTGFLDA